MAASRPCLLTACVLACLTISNAVEVKLSKWMDPSECTGFELPGSTAQGHYQLLLTSGTADLRCVPLHIPFAYVCCKSTCAICKR